MKAGGTFCVPCLNGLEGPTSTSEAIRLARFSTAAGARLMVFQHAESVWRYFRLCHVNFGHSYIDTALRQTDPR